MDKKEYLKIRTSLGPKDHRFRMLQHLLVDALLVGVLIAGWQLGKDSWWLFAGSALVCILMFRSFALMHEAVHGCAADSKLNDYIGVFYGGICFLAYEPWKQAHIEHHYWSGNADKDPVMAMLIIFPKLPSKIQNFLTHCWRIWFPILGILQHLVFWTISIKKGFTRNISLKSALSLTWPLAFWSTVFLTLPTSMLMMFVVPGVFLYLVLTEFVNLPHHLRLPQRTGEDRLQIWNQHESARSCVYPAWMEKYITLNFNYHTEHHMFPDLSWYQLKEVHSILKEKLGAEMNLDAQFDWTRKHRTEVLSYVLAKDILTERAIEMGATGSLSAQALKSSPK